MPTSPPPSQAPPAPEPTWASIDEATTTMVDAWAEGLDDLANEAQRYIYPRLNGMNPEGMVTELSTVRRKDALYRVLSIQKGVDFPRLATGIAGVMSKKEADTLAALELLDQLRNTGGSTTFWANNVAPLSAARLREILLVADRTVHIALRDALENAPPRVHQKVGPVLGRLFNPPAGEIVLEFVPDQFDVAAIITKPDGTIVPGYAPIGVLTATVAGRVGASVRAQGGMWQSQDAGGGHRADPTKPGIHKLGGRQKVKTSFWPPSQITQGTSLREITKAGKPAVEYQGEDGRWHDTRSLPKPITREEILEYVRKLREQLEAPEKKAARELVPDGVIPSKMDLQ